MGTLAVEVVNSLQNFHMRFSDTQLRLRAGGTQISSVDGQRQEIETEMGRNCFGTVFRMHEDVVYTLGQWRTCITGPVGPSITHR